MVIASLVAAYVLGSVPFSLIIGKKVKGIDLREHGSGNLGATNVYRNLGAGWGGLCLLLDMGKGALAVGLTTIAAGLAPAGEPLPLHLTADIYRIVAAIAAILGHSFSPFASFRGGKGIATTAGAFAMLEPLAILAALVVFGAVFAATRIVSLGSICAAAVFPIAVLFFELRSADVSSTLIVFSFLLAALVIWRHRANIRRLQAGTEKKLTGPPEDEMEIARRAADQTMHDLAPPDRPLDHPRTEEDDR
ncbi:glycerol-3-phosphate 1-O-acyltransferase PlsY [bacterium]|nr:glycerol-3-phosphate 1-O-acyltransferase PlsY [bacterium]